MSKSLGNVIAPQKVFNSLGADILRLWVSATDYTSEMTVSDDILKRTADSYRRIRNTARFLLSNLSGFNPETDMVSGRICCLWTSGRLIVLWNCKKKLSKLTTTTAS